MKKNKIIIVLSSGIIAGFIAGIIVVLPYILSHRYIQYKMFRLVLLDSQNFLNKSILLFFIVFLLSYLFWILALKKRKFEQNKIIKFAAKGIGLLALLFYVSWVMKCFATFSLLNFFKISFTKLQDLLNGKISFNVLVGKAGKYFTITDIAVIAGIFILIFFLWRLSRTFIREKLPKIIKPSYIKITSLFVVVIVVILNLFTVIDRKMKIPKGPNVILIVCDALRADHLGCFGYKTDITENIDLLTEESVNFKNAYAQAPCTNPSMWNIMTSRYHSAVPAKNEYMTIAKFFRSRNYRTAAFISQKLLEGTSPNIHKGFDIYDTKCDTDHHGMSARKAESVTNAAIRWIEQNRKDPFFIWLVYFEPHDPYIPPGKFKGYYNKTEKFNGDRRSEGIGYKSSKNRLVSEEHRQFLINAYDEEIRYLDHEIGRLLGVIRSRELYKDSMIILTSDHGEELGDNNHLWDHCQLLSQEEIWIPLIMKFPGQKKLMVIEEAVQHIDILPTLIEFLNKNGKAPHYSSIEGQSLVPLLKREEKLKEDRVALSFWHEQRCIIKGNFKYWQWDKKEFLIDVKTGEEVKNPEIRKELKSLLDKQKKKKRDYYEETIEKLKSLGYLK